MKIRSYDPPDQEDVVRLALRAWTPVFESIRRVMSPDVYRVFYPDGWKRSQQKAVEEVCAAADVHVWIAVEDGATVGFVALKLHAENKMGEVYMVAVDPDFQGYGIGKALTAFALDWMKEAGMSVAMVETGGDPGHGPARRLYESAGFGRLEIARYFKKL